MRSALVSLCEQLNDILYGQELVVRHVVIGLLAGGHVLLQGVPGVGKTRLARALSQLVGGTYRRVQFTPDLLPSDVTGNAVYLMQEGRFEVQQGPVFTHVLLADEINRTPPKTQAALLQAMEERQVTIYGETYDLPVPFFVIATQNPIEYEGTYNLPEAQLDRFLMQVVVSYPEAAAEQAMLVQHRAGMAHEFGRLAAVFTPQELAALTREIAQVVATPAVVEYIVALVRATRVRDDVSLGASPRAATAILDAARVVAFLDDREYVIPDDILDIIQPVLRHRLLLSPQAQLEGVQADDVLRQVVEVVPVPR